MQERYSGRSRSMAASIALPSSLASSACRGDSPVEAGSMAEASMASGESAHREPSIETVSSSRLRRKSIATLLAILKSQLESLNSGL